MLAYFGCLFSKSWNTSKTHKSNFKRKITKNINLKKKKLKVSQIHPSHQHQSPVPAYYNSAPPASLRTMVGVSQHLRQSQLHQLLKLPYRHSWRKRTVYSKSTRAPCLFFLRHLNFPDMAFVGYGHLTICAIKVVYSLNARNGSCRFKDSKETCSSWRFPLSASNRIWSAERARNHQQTAHLCFKETDPKKKLEGETKWFSNLFSQEFCWVWSSKDLKKGLPDARVPSTLWRHTIGPKPKRGLRGNHEEKN